MRVLRAIDSGQPPFQLEQGHVASLRLDSTILQRTWDPVSTRRPSAFELATAVEACWSQENKVGILDHSSSNQPAIT